jgi:hypothetical protein
VSAVKVLADSQYQWFYWIAPILFLSFLGLVAMLSMGYVKKVLLPKYRGKRVE